MKLSGRVPVVETKKRQTRKLYSTLEKDKPKEKHKHEGIWDDLVER